MIHRVSVRRIDSVHFDCRAHWLRTKVGALQREEEDISVRTILSFPLLFVSEVKEVPLVTGKGMSGPCPPGNSPAWYEIT